jgi:hypothetical protein
MGNPPAADPPIGLFPVSGKALTSLKGCQATAGWQRRSKRRIHDWSQIEADNPWMAAPTRAAGEAATINPALEQHPTC